MKKFTYLLAVAAVFTACNSGNNGYTVTGTVEKEHKIEFKSLPPYINIPTDVQQIYQDRDGFIWRCV